MDYHMTDIIPLLPIPQPPYGKVSYNIPCPKCQSGSQHRKGRLNIKEGCVSLPQVWSV